MRTLALAVLVVALGASSSGCVRLYHEAVHHQRNCKESAEYGSWDTLLFFMTIGMPFLILEALTLVPFVVDYILIYEHDRHYRLGRFECRRPHK